MKKLHRKTRVSIVVILCCLVAVVPSCFATANILAKEAQKIAKEAYVYGFPMVVNYKTLYNYAVDKKSPDYKGPFNEMKCEARLFTPKDRAVVTPNSDTPYCMFWMDLRPEPLVLTVPEIEQDRLYHFQFVDLYTHNFAYVGTLTTGNNAGSFLIVGPSWVGDKPEGVTAIIRSETNYIFNVTRTQLFNTDDLNRVKTIQQSYELQSLSSFLNTNAPASEPLPDFPQWIEGAQFDERFFNYLDFMMSLLKKPGDGEQELWDGLARLGIGTGQNFEITALPPELQTALKTGVQEGFKEIELFLAQNGNDPLGSAKIFGTREFLTNSAEKNYALKSPFMVRAAAAHIGVFGNSAAEAIYPTYQIDNNQQPLNAATNSYTLTFPKGDLPPVKAFWSLTMYDGKTQLFVENEFNRYLLNSTMLDQFKMEQDGSLVLHVSKDSPGNELESNWLPAPDGPFYMVMRLYGPEDEALEGNWMQPGLMKSE